MSVFSSLAVCCLALLVGLGDGRVVYDLHFVDGLKGSPTTGTIVAASGSPVVLDKADDQYEWLVSLVKLKQHDFTINGMAYTVYPFSHIMQGEKCMGYFHTAAVGTENVILAYTGGDNCAGDDGCSVIVEIVPGQEDSAYRAIGEAGSNVRYKFQLAIAQLAGKELEYTYDIYLDQAALPFDSDYHFSAIGGSAPKEAPELLMEINAEGVEQMMQRQNIQNDVRDFLQRFSTDITKVETPSESKHAAENEAESSPEEKQQSDKVSETEEDSKLL